MVNLKQLFDSVPSFGNSSDAFKGSNVNSASFRNSVLLVLTAVYSRA